MTYEIDGTVLPRPMQPMVIFASILRANGFTVAPDQVISWIEGIGLLGSHGPQDIRRAGIATLSIPRDRQPEFNALFDAYFLGLALPAALEGEDDETEAHEPEGAGSEIIDEPDEDEAGEEATAAERLGHRTLAERRDDALMRLARLGPARLPKRRSRRLVAARNGDRPDLRRTLQAAARTGGEVMDLAQRKRRMRQRRLVLLIDVSGSMRERTEASLTLAHTLVRTAERVEVFSLGTRLTRITPALRPRRLDQALARASGLIADIDGGTRIGDALTAFLDVPRFAGQARGAAACVLSDGLERGTPDALVLATIRLSRLAWRLDWLTPLPIGEEPQTEGLRAIRPWLTSLTDSADTPRTVEHLLTMAHQWRRAA
ncbi:MAG: VWA domain-containing protein [Pseudomonadota bacterium]